MRREYESPVLYAEEFVFSESIAKCQDSVDPNVPETITYGENVCGGGGDGHNFGGQNGGKGTIHDEDGVGPGQSITLFSDGTGNACQYDWDYKNNVVYFEGESRGSFAQAFYGNDASVSSHAPGHLEAAFFS